MTYRRDGRTIRSLALALLFAPLAAAAATQSQIPEAILGAALHLEEVEADLEAAIVKYEQVVGHIDADRATAGRALLHIGICYEKLDAPREAAVTYERVIKDFRDRPEIVSEALVRVRSLDASAIVALPGQELVSRRIFQFPPRMGGGSPSPDGRYFSKVDWETGNIAVVDLSNNEMRTLSDEGYPGMPFGSLFSPDSRTIAYGWLDGDRWDLRLIDIDGTGRRALYAPDVGVVGLLQDWSEDGRWILAITATRPNSGEIVLISVVDGSTRVVKELTATEGAIFNANAKAALSPDGRFVVHDLTLRPGGGRDISVISVADGTERPLIQSQAVDRAPIWSPDGSQVLFLSDRGGSFDLWAQRVVEGQSEGAPELLRAGIRDIVGMTDEGSLYYSVGLTVFDLQTADYDAEAGTLTPQNANSFATRPGLNNRPLWSPDGRHLLYYHRPAGTRAGGARLLVVLNTETGEERELTLTRREFGGAFKPLGFSPDGRKVLLYGLGREPTEPALYWMDFATGVTERAVGGWAVNARLAPDGNTVYAPNFRPDGIAAVDLTTGGDRRVGPPVPENSISGFAFALSPNGGTLAYQPQEDGAWARGLFLMDVASGEARSLGDLPAYWELAWTPDGRYLLGVLGSEDNDGASSGSAKAVVWKIPLDGAEPEPTSITIGSDPAFAGFTFHPDGRTLTYVDGQQVSEVWLLENLMPTSRSR